MANDSQRARPYKADANKTFKEMQEKLTTTKQKLNKYKRKLKKYLAGNAELQRDLKLTTEQNSNLRTQNATLLKCDEQKEGISQVLQEQLGSLEKQMMSMRQSYEDQIKQLSEENFSMLTELQDRDERQRVLQEKLEYVENEIESIGMQLKEQSDINALLREQMALQSEDPSTNQLNPKNQIQNAEIHQLRSDNQRLSEEQYQMQLDYQQLQMKMLSVEKENFRLEQEIKERDRRAATFKSQDYLQAIGEERREGGKLSDLPGLAGESSHEDRKHRDDKRG